MPLSKPYVVGPARGAPYPTPAINIPNLIRQVENLTHRVETLEAALGYQNFDSFDSGVQWAPDADGKPTALPAPMGTSFPGGGEGQVPAPEPERMGPDREVVRPWAHVGDPRRHLTHDEIARIKRLHVVPPTDEGFYEQLIRDTRREERWFKVFLAKHYIDSIKELGTHASKSQKQFVANWKDPEWFSQAVLLDAKKREKREKREKAEKPADPDLQDVPAWIHLLAENKSRRPHGIQFEGNMPNESQLRGWLIFKQIGPARPSSKEASRRTRNIANHVICRYFSDHADEYRGTVMSLGCTISEMWAPTRYQQGENVEINDFLRHAAICGLQHEMAEGPLRAFATQWLADYTGPAVA